jgi:calcium-dependent protein kinase
MWSVGVLFYVLITGNPPFDGKTNEELYEKICSAEFTFFGREWDQVPEAKNLIYHLLQFDPNERYDAHEAVNHSFFN